MNKEEVLQNTILEGVHAGGIESIRQARITNTKLIIWRDGKIVEITPDEADAMLKEREENK